MESFYVSSVSSLLCICESVLLCRCFKGDLPAVWSSPTHTSPPTKTLHLVNRTKQAKEAAALCVVKTSRPLFDLFIFYKKKSFFFFLTFLYPSALHWIHWSVLCIYRITVTVILVLTEQ